MNTVPPIRREILVEADPAVAFEVFTSGLGRWWPVAELSVHGEGGSVSFHGAFAGGRSWNARPPGKPPSGAP